MRIVRRPGVLSALAGAALLAGCAARDPYVNGMMARFGEWGTEHHVDRVTGAPISNSVLVTRNVSYGPMLVPPPATLQLMCFKEQPAVLVLFQVKIGSTRNAEVAYRFDDKPGHEPRVRIVDDHKSVLIDDPQEVTQFVNELATSDTLYLRIRALTAPRSSAEFKVAGASPAIASAYAGCPLNGAATARASVAPPAKEKAQTKAQQDDDDDD